MNRVIVLVDGFNLYHSIKDIDHNNNGLCLKWLDIYSLCQSYLYLISPDAILEKVYYFSAYAYHLGNPDIIKRHKTYIKCLEATGIEAILGRFKYKEIKCANCHKTIGRYEEKETDVAIGVKFCEVLTYNLCDTIVLITGDTDLAPVVRYAKQYHPKNNIIFLFPYGRKNSELVDLASKAFKIGKNSYAKHQFPDPFILPNGSKIEKPASWR